MFTGKAISTMSMVALCFLPNGGVNSHHKAWLIVWSREKVSGGRAATLIFPRELEFIKFLFKIPISIYKGGEASPVAAPDRAVPGNQTLCWSLSRRDQYHIRAQWNTWQFNFAASLEINTFGIVLDFPTGYPLELIYGVISPGHSVHGHYTV